MLWNLLALRCIGVLCKKETTASTGSKWGLQPQERKESLQWWLRWWELRLHCQEWGKMDGPLWNWLFNWKRVIWPGIMSWVFFNCLRFIFERKEKNQLDFVLDFESKIHGSQNYAQCNCHFKVVLRSYKETKVLSYVNVIGTSLGCKSLRPSWARVGSN